MQIARMRVGVAVGIALLPLLAACGGADLGVPDGLEATPAPALVPSPVTLTVTDLPSTLEVGQVVRFRVRAQARDFFDDERITLALQNPPPGCTVATVDVAGTVATAAGQWVVSSAWTGPVRLQFRVGTIRQGVHHRSTDVQVVGSRLRGINDHREAAGVRIGDVTGDGLVDVVATATNDGLLDVGALHVFAGATTPGTSPTASLRDPLGSRDDRLGTDVPFGAISESSLVHLVDVTGDGVLDVVVAVPLSDRGGTDAGAVLVWKGGPGLSGTPGPHAILQASVPATGARLGSNGFLGSLLFADVVGDGAVDIVAAAPADTAPPSLDGSVLVWRGGSALAGVTPGSTVPETARFTSDVPAGAPAVGSGRVALRAADVTGDGRRDLVVSGTLVFAGGSTVTGVRLPTANLVASALIGGPAFGSGTYDSLRLGDVTGDGVADIVRTESTVLSGNAHGFAHVWRGGSGLVGDAVPQHRLTEASGLPRDMFTTGAYRLEDVTGDGVLDVLSVAPLAGPGDTRRGEVRVWSSAQLTGAFPLPVRLRGSLDGGSLGFGSLLEDALHVVDLTGDGVLDVVVAQGAATVVAGSIVTRVAVFAGGTTLTGPGDAVRAPTFELQSAAATISSAGASAFQPLSFEDFDGDGRLDVVRITASDPFALQAGTVDAWRGRASATGVLGADAHVDLPVAKPSVFTALATAFAPSTAVADADRDGKPDLVVLLTPSSSATSPVARILPGATLFAGVPSLVAMSLGATQSAETAPSLTGVHGARVPLLLADLTGDRRLELIGAAPRADAAGAASGMVGVWDLTRIGVPAFNPFGTPTHRVLGSTVQGRSLPSAARGPQGILVGDLTGDGVVELLVVDPVASFGDGEISFVLGGSPFPTGASGASGRFSAGGDADGLGR